MRPAPGLVLALALAFPSLAAAQDLTLRGLTGQSVTLTPADIAALPHVSLTLTVEGKTHAYDGVPLTAILAKVGAPSGKALRGVDLSDVVIVHAGDGYVVALALAETDPMVRSDEIILADKADGAPMGEGLGPYRLVVEGDLRAARSERMVTSIELKQLGTPKAAAPGG